MFSWPQDGNRKDDRTFEPRTKLRQVWMQSYKDDTFSTQTEASSKSAPSQCVEFRREKSMVFSRFFQQLFRF